MGLSVLGIALSLLYVGLDIHETPEVAGQAYLPRRGGCAVGTAIADALADQSNAQCLPVAGVARIAVEWDRDGRGPKGACARRGCWGVRCGAHIRRPPGPGAQSSPVGSDSDAAKVQ